MRAAVAASPGVTRVLVTVRGRGWILLRGTAVPLEIVGASPGVPRWFPQAPSDQPGLVVSERIAARLGLGVGEPATLVSPVPGLTPLGPQPRLRTVPFAGTYRAGRSDPDERAAVPLEVAVRLFGNAEKVLDVEVESLDHAVAVAASIRRAFPTAEVATWQELNRGLFFALRLERTVMFVAVGLIVLVAALALVSDLGLIITNKRAEIGILGTMGAGASELRAVFTWLGGVIAFVGIFCGLAFGVTAAVVLDRTRGLALPGGGFFLDYVPFHVEAGDVLTVSLATAALSWIFCRSAAGAAVKLRPVEALRRA
jgi:lipoprotein-releasing system permease protein